MAQSRQFGSSLMDRRGVRLACPTGHTAFGVRPNTVPTGSMAAR